MINKKDSKGATVWFTGLACSGKTTIARRIKEILGKKGVDIIVLDSDELRSTVSKNLGFTLEDRDKHMRLVANICCLITSQGALNLAAVISPTKRVREEARKKVGDFIEVYVKCPLEICKKRDVKGHYKEFEEGKLKNLVGMDITYEEPLNPDVIVETDREDVNSCVSKIISKMEDKGFI